MSLPRRIVKETQRLTQEPVPGITAIPFEDNMRYFNVIISGPDDSPYEAGVFRLELFLPADYPMAPPKVRFLTNCLLYTSPSPRDATLSRMPSSA